MIEESIHNFPKENIHELVQAHIESELKKVGIELQLINIDGTVITNKEVPEEIMSNIREYAEFKGINIEFLTA